jgi:hypothetical protein
MERVDEMVLGVVVDFSVSLAFVAPAGKSVIA